LLTASWKATAWDALVAVALLLALETQLRTGDGPLGPGEALLLVWLTPILFRLVIARPRFVPKPFWEVCRFWVALGAALSLGFGATIVRDVPVDLSLVVHDVAAYILLVAFTCALTISPVAPARLHAVAWMTVLCGSTLLLLQLANSAGWFSLPRIDPWYWDRMRGWCDNPNQFALLCLLLGFMAVALAEKASRLAWSAIASGCAALAFGVGLLAKSNAFLAVVVAGLLLFAFAKFGRLAFRAERGGAPAASLALGIAAAIAWVLCAASPVTGLGIGELKSTTTMARGGEGDSEDAALRVQLWEQAIKVGVGSWALGLGPGPHLEIPQSILAGRRDENVPINLQHPAPGLAANFEAHNTVLELFVQGGLAAVTAFLAVLAMGIYRSWKSQANGMVALLFSMMVFGSFHVIFRHPIVWFVLCLALVQRPCAEREAARTRPTARAGLVRRRLFWARRAIAQPIRRELSV
jgi:hypothetical protein